MDAYDELINRMLNDPDTKANYEKYIIKDITFEEWVTGACDDILFLYLKQCTTPTEFDIIHP